MIEKYASERALTLNQKTAPPKEDYHKYPAVSRTALEWIIPSSGGSLEKYNYLTITAPVMDEEVSKAMNVGTAVHLYAEDINNFTIKVIKKPGPGLKRVIDSFPDTITPASLTAHETEVVDMAYAADYGKTWSRPVVFKKIVEEGLEYLASLRDKTPGVYYASPDEHAIISQCVSSLSTRTPINDPGTFYGHEWELKTEVPFLFEMGGIEFKVLIDRLLLNHEDKLFIVEDIKTTRFSIPEFTGYQRRRIVAGTFQMEEVTGKMYDAGIHRQLEFYKGVVGLFYPGYACKEVAVLAQQTIAPYAFERRIISQGWLDVAKADLREGIDAVLENEHAKSYDL